MCARTSFVPPHKAAVKRLDGSSFTYPRSSKKLFDFILYMKCGWHFIEAGDNIQDLINKHSSRVTSSQRWRVVEAKTGQIVEQE